MWKFEISRKVASTLFPPSFVTLFRLRITVRLAKIGLQRRWRLHSFRPIAQSAPRPLMLLVIGFGLPIIAVIILAQLFPSETDSFVNDLRGLLSGKPGREPLQWREAIQLLVLAVGIPAAFILWFFRDQNMQATVENQRKDVNLKEFQEIIVRATGRLELSDGFAESDVLAVAATHQLRSYLSGEFGDGFRRPAWELLKASLADKRKYEAFKALQEFIDTNSTPSGILNDDINLDPDSGYQHTLKKLLEPLRRIRNDDAISQVISEEIDSICLSNLPLTYSNFAQIHFRNHANFSSLDLAEASFVAGFLSWAHFEHSDLWRANFQQSDISFGRFEFARGAGVRFEHANLMAATFDRSQFMYSSFIGADLSAASFQFADIQGARFDGNHSLRRASFRGSNCENAKFRQSDMSFCDLSGCRLGGADFAETNLFHANLRDAKFGEINTIPLFMPGGMGTRFRGADLTDACVEGTDLRGVDPAALISCQGMTFDRSTILGDRDNSFNGVAGNAAWEKAALEWIDRDAVLVDKRPKWPHPTAT